MYNYLYLSICNISGGVYWFSSNLSWLVCFTHFLIHYNLLRWLLLCVSISFILRFTMIPLETEEVSCQKCNK